MSVAESVNDILEADIPTSFERFGKLLDARWIDAALQQTGTASVRRRKLSAQLVVWLVIGMALFRDKSIQAVVSHLGLVLPSEKNKRPAAGKTVAKSAIPQARYRVGAEPIEAIFERTAETWALAAADEHRWRGLALYGVDGTTLRVPDTDQNREAFGLPATGRGQSGYPQVRLVALMALRSHLGPWPSVPLQARRAASAPWRCSSGLSCPTNRSSSWTRASSTTACSTV
jgi:hypothetical protein